MYACLSIVCNFIKWFNSVSLSHTRVSLHVDSIPLPEFPKPPAHPCTDDDLKICDFKKDCPAGEDEAQCGEFLYYYVHVMLRLFVINVCLVLYLRSFKKDHMAHLFPMAHFLFIYTFSIYFMM